MYNLASILKSVINELDDKKCRKLAALKAAALGMKSLHSGDAWKTSKAGGKGRRMYTIPEEGRGSEPQDEDGWSSEPEDEDDLGVFDDHVICAALSQMNYQVAYVAYGVCVPSIA
jgi:hypothetical protein